MGLLKKYNEEDFRNKIRSSNHAIHEKYDELDNTPRSSYVDVVNSNVKKFSTAEQHIERRVGLPTAAPIDISGEGVIDYTVRNVGSQDKINLFPIICSQDRDWETS